MVAIPGDSHRGFLPELTAQMQAAFQDRWLLLLDHAPTLAHPCLHAATAALVRNVNALGADAEGRLVLIGLAGGGAQLAGFAMNRPMSMRRMVRLMDSAEQRVTFVNTGLGLNCASDISPCIRDLASDTRPARLRLRALLEEIELSSNDRSNEPTWVRSQDCVSTPFVRP